MDAYFLGLAIGFAFLLFCGGNLNAGTGAGGGIGGGTGIPGSSGVGALNAGNLSGCGSCTSVVSPIPAPLTAPPVVGTPTNYLIGGNPNYQPPKEIVPPGFL